MPIKVLVADDHGVVRAALRALLRSESGIEVMGEAADSAETLRQAEAYAPDIVLLDMSMPGTGGLEVTRQLVKAFPGLRVLILTVHEDERLVREAIEAGASGYIIKRALDSELISAIRAVASGNIYIHPALTRAFLKREQAVPGSAGSQAEAVVSLTPRETEVLQLIARGYTNSQVAEALSLSVRTVETHRANLMAKLNVSSRVEMVRYAKEHGLFDQG